MKMFQKDEVRYTKEMLKSVNLVNKGVTKLYKELKKMGWKQWEIKVIIRDGADWAVNQETILARIVNSR